jgi:hypothetical protein
MRGGVYRYSSDPSKLRTLGRRGNSSLWLPMCMNKSRNIGHAAAETNCSRYKRTYAAERFLRANEAHRF